jgi:hypothetical protein
MYFTALCSTRESNSCLNTSDCHLYYQNVLTAHGHQQDEHLQAQSNQHELTGSNREMAKLPKHPRRFHSLSWTRVEWTERRKPKNLQCDLYAVSGKLRNSETQFQATWERGGEAIFLRFVLHGDCLTYLRFYVSFWFVCFPDIRKRFQCLLNKIIRNSSGSFLSHPQVT